MIDKSEVKYLFSPPELTAKHDRFFILPRFLLLFGIAGWMFATLEQIQYLQDERAALAQGVFPLLVWYAAYTAGLVALVRRYPMRRRIIYQAAICLDVAFITLLINQTGILQSNFYLAYYLFIAMEVFHFGMIGGALLTVSCCMIYFFLYYSHSEQLFAGDFAFRAGFMMLTYLVLAALEENEKRSRMQLEKNNAEIESLNDKLERSNQRLIEDNEFKEMAAREKSELLQREHDAAQRRRLHIDFAKELNAKETIEEAVSVHSRYVCSLLGADHVSVITLDTKKRNALLYSPAGGDIDLQLVPYNHPLIEHFYGAGHEPSEPRRTWAADSREAMPDPFMIVPGEPALLHVEALAGGVMGMPIMIAMSADEKDAFDLELMEEARLIGNHLAVAIKNLSLRAKLQEMADTDGLTGIYNHRYLQEMLAGEIRRTRRYNRPLSMILFDIDHFKKFNDTYGHPVGDAVLKGIADKAGSLLRGVDILARYGGEEFAVVLPETDKSSALGVAERIRRSISSHTFEFQDVEPLHVTVSLGVGSIPPAETQEDLIRMADEALYRAKENGRDCVAS